MTPLQWRRQGAKRARGVRHTPGVMNRLEAKYALLLEARRRAGEIEAYWFEALTLKLGKDCRFTADFLVLENDMTITLVEVKGATKTKYELKATGAKKRIPRVEDDSKAKCAVVAEQFPFRVVMTWPGEGGTWEEKQL